MRSKSQLQKRGAAIRKATPNILEELFEMQNRICDLCGFPIQDLVFAALDHSVPVIVFARGPMSTKEAIRQANDSSNLRAVHFSCNSKKQDMTREEWFEKVLDKKVGEPRIWTRKEIKKLQDKLSEIGRAGSYLAHKTRPEVFKENGRKAVETGQIYEMLNLPQTKAAQRRNGHRLGQENIKTGYSREIGRKWGPINGPKNGGKAVKEGRAWGRTREGCVKGGTETARQSIINGKAQEFGEIWGPINGRKAVDTGQLASVASAGGIMSNHIRWHVNRGIVNPDCPHCASNS
jgi:hypothetical protein